MGSGPPMIPGSGKHKNRQGKSVRLNINARWVREQKIRRIFLMHSILLIIKYFWNFEIFALKILKSTWHIQSGCVYIELNKIIKAQYIPSHEEFNPN